VKTLRFHVSRLRAALAVAGAPDAIVTRGGAYSLQTRGDDVDAHAFARLVDAARRACDSAEALGLLRTALALWRGPALSDVADEPFALPEATRLDELRTAAEDDALAAMLEGGEHHRVVAEAERLVGLAPFRERRWELLITALYRAGRQAEALAAFQRLRQTLLDELGVDPSPPLRELERRILTQDDSLALTVPPAPEDRLVELVIPLPPPFATPSLFPFAGRLSERDRLAARWKDSLGGERQVVLVSGEPGIGKTRLVTELARDVHADGAVVALGRCDGELPDAYLPFAEAVRPLVDHLPDEVLAAHVEAAGAHLCRLAPNLSRRLSGIGEVTAGDAEDERLQLFDAVADLAQRVAARQPVLLVLEDLHWADPASLLLLRYLVRTVQATPFTVVATYRDTDLARTHPLAAWLADLRREAHVERIDLPGLTEAEVVALLEGITGRTATDGVHRLAGALQVETDGNPFFVGEVLLHLREAGALHHTDGEWHGDAALIERIGIPQGIREVVGRRLAALPGDAAEMLGLAAIFGAEVPLGALARLSERSPESLLAPLSVACTRSLLAEVVGVVDRYRFTHDLVRQTLYEELPTSRRVRLHAAAAAALADDGAPAAVVAHHYSEAAGLGLVDEAIRWHRRAADEATAALAYEQAVAHLEAAVDADGLRDPVDAAGRAELFVELGTAMNRSVDNVTARGVFRDAIELAEAAGRDDLVVAACLEFGGMGDNIELADCAGVPLLDRAAAIIGPEDSADHVHLLLRRAAWKPLDTPPDQRTELRRSARHMAERLGDERLVARALSREVDIDDLLDDPTRLYEGAAALEAAAPRTGSVGARLEAHRVRMAAHLRLGRLRDAIDEFGLMHECAESGGFVLLVEYTGALLDVLRGDIDAGEATFRRLVDIHQRAGRTGYPAASALGIIMALRGRGAERRAVTDTTSATGGRYNDRRPWAALHAVGAGRFDDAGPALVRWLDDDAPLLTPFRQAESVAMVAAIAARTRLPELCRRLDDLMAPYSGQWIAYTGQPWGATDHYRALLARGAGDVAAAEALLRAALAAYEREGERPWRAHATIELADVLGRRNSAGDAEEAAALADAASGAAEAMGLEGVARRVARVRERLQT
jgi:DNA-binding SARP family transcriptional activator